MQKWLLKIGYGLILVAGGIGLVWQLAIMVGEISARAVGDRAVTQGKIVFHSRTSIQVAYKVDNKEYRKLFSRGILRFDFGRVGEERGVLYLKSDPSDAILDPPFGGWVFWTTDLALILAVFSSVFLVFKLIRIR